MFNRVLIIMFALLFASQTIAAAFDLHRAHQETDTNQSLSHRTLDESHQSHQEGELARSQAADNGETQESFDCHHCCHCHAPAGVYIACRDESNLVHQENANVIAMKTALHSLWISPEHRPPIA